ncbi:MAG TPA: gephyrin-like molybdotransferase Glp [Anaeromyxobacteraceae bacterium]|nr:gephyrin-like molybdotransferase Glp [Anaeromyxobacteraceae bacterium]
MSKLDRYRREVLESVEPVSAERLGVPAASGRYLAEGARARLDAPAFSCSAMDGYAVRAEGLAEGAELRVVESLYAGDRPGRALGPGEAARIFTGAPLPSGADAVVREEAAEREGERVRLSRAPRRGEHVRQAGEDVRAGSEALPAGVRLGPRQLALLAAVGVSEVAVRRSVKVALVSTGDELVRGLTPNSNGAALRGLVEELGAGCEPSVVGDDLEAVRQAIANGLASADAVLTTGGVSVGERDHVPLALERLAATVRVHGVPMKPGKPFLFARAGEKPVLALPGSPSACLVAFEVFVRPALLRMAGASRVERPRVLLPLAERAEGRAGRARFLWAALTPDGRVRPLGRDAAQVKGPAQADALVYLPEGRGDLEAGEAVETWILGA